MYIGLLDEDFSGFCAQGFDLGLFDDLTPPKLFDLTVQVAHHLVEFSKAPPAAGAAISRKEDDGAGPLL